MQYYEVMTNPIWRSAASTKIVMSVYLYVKKWSDYDMKIWYAESDINYM